VDAIPSSESTRPSRARATVHAFSSKRDSPAVPLVSGLVTELDVQVHNKASGRDEMPIIIDYWAPWCGPCRSMAPEFAKAALKLKSKARFAKIDTEQHPEVSQKLGIRGIPLLILYSNGKEVARLAGARPAADIEDFVLQSIKA